MRITFLSILLINMLPTFAADVETSGIIYSIPDGFSLSRQINTQANEFRGVNGERWNVTVMKFSSNLTVDQLEMVGTITRLIEKKEQSLNKTVDIYKRANVVHKFEKKSLNDGAALLILGSQILRTGKGMPTNGQIYSEIDFNIYWSDTHQILDGRVEWPGDLQSNFESYVNRIMSIKRENQPNLTVERDASRATSQLAPRPSP